MSELGDILPLAQCPHLTTLSFMDNPITRHPHYRAWVIHALGSRTNLRTLDFRRVREKERKDAHARFTATEEGRALAASFGAATSAVPVTTLRSDAADGAHALSQHAQDNIKKAIAAATSLDQVARLERQLRTGHVPTA